MTSGASFHKPSLEGIRALAFLLVFMVHFSGPTWTLANRPLWDYPWLLTCQISFCSVPVFFALSGYLITRVLLGSVHERGYFRVFYLRRAIRILPLYYLTLLGIAIAAFATGAHFLLRYLLLLTYLFNFWPHNGYYNISSYIQIGHLWSLAVEEQFYLVWPIAVWLLPDRRKLLRLCYWTIAASFIGRMSWPLWHIHSFEFVYQNTLFRCDAIMLGAVLAIKEGDAVDALRRLVVPARISLSICCTIIVARALYHKEAMPFDNFGVIILMPALSVMGAALVVLALEPRTWTARASTKTWAVFLGKRSYALYVFHQLYTPLFLDRVIPFLTTLLGRGFGRIVGLLAAFTLTAVTAEIAFRLVETPALRLKKRIRYGIPNSTPQRTEGISIQDKGFALPSNNHLMS